MTDVITVNPFIVEDVKRVLSFIEQYPDDEFIFRMPMIQGNKLSMDMIKVEQIATMRTYSEYVSEDLTENSYIGFGDEDPLLLALVELFKTKDDVDVRLPMGFTVYEIPILSQQSPPASLQSSSSAQQLLPQPSTQREEKELQQISRETFMTIEDTIAYLNSIGAQYIGEKNMDDDKIDDEIWVGIDVEDKDHKRKSTMYFETQHIYKRMTGNTAIELLNRYLQKEDTNIQGIILSLPHRTRIFVVKNDICEFIIPKNHPRSTEPETKQRMMYLYDIISDWVNKNSFKLLKVNYNRLLGFEYSFESGWNKGQEIITDSNLAIKHFLKETNPWEEFVSSTSNKTPEELLRHKVLSMCFLFESYGIDIPEEDLKGDWTPYIPQTGFVPIPTRTTTPIVSASIRTPLTPKSRPNSAPKKSPAQA